MISTPWVITISNFLGGLAPAYWKGDFPFYANINQAGKLQNVNILDPSYITQGLGIANLTEGTQAGVVTTLMRGILDTAVASSQSYAIGGNLLYLISDSAVANDSKYPHTIDKTGVTGEVGEDVAYYQDNIYYSYNHSGTLGDIGKVSTSTTPSSFDDAWGSTKPAAGAHALIDAPHEMETAENDMLYIANGSYITSYDGTSDIFVEQDLDFPTNAVISSLKWNQARLWTALNRPNLTGSNRTMTMIYPWDGNSESWDDDTVFCPGRVGALFVKDGTLFAFHEDVTTSGCYRLGYVNGGTLKDIATFTGSLPAYYQVTQYNGVVTWASGAYIYTWGASDPGLPAALSQIMSTGYSTVGGIATPFGDILVASNSSTNYKIVKSSGYEVNSFWKSKMFDCSGNSNFGRSQIDKIAVNSGTLATGAKVDFTLNINLGSSTWTDSLSFVTDGAARQKIYYPGIEASNFRFEMDWTNGSASNPVDIYSIIISGHTL